MYLFVYGTLRRQAAHPMHHWLESAGFTGTGWFQGQLYDVGSFPAAIASNHPADVVLGEVYRLIEPTPILSALDQYEGCASGDPTPHEYRRAVADIRLETGTVVSAQIYLYQWPTDGLTRIVEGDYLAWLARQASGPADALETRTPPAGSTTASC